MKNLLIKWKDVGRSKATGEASYSEYDEDDPYAESNLNAFIVQKVSAYLLSSDISCVEGKVFAGFRTVGTYEIIED